MAKDTSPTWCDKIYMSTAKRCKAGGNKKERVEKKSEGQNIEKSEEPQVPMPIPVRTTEMTSLPWSLMS